MKTKPSGHHSIHTGDQKLRVYSMATLPTSIFSGGEWSVKYWVICEIICHYDNLTPPNPLTVFPAKILHRSVIPHLLPTSSDCPYNHVIQVFLASVWWILNDIVPVLLARKSTPIHAYTPSFAVTWNAAQLPPRFSKTHAILFDFPAPRVLKTTHPLVILRVWIPLHDIASNAIVASP